MRILPLKESVVEKLESMGFRRSYIKKGKMAKAPGGRIGPGFQWLAYLYPCERFGRGHLVVLRGLGGKKGAYPLAILAKFKPGKKFISWLRAYSFIWFFSRR